MRKVSTRLFLAIATVLGLISAILVTTNAATGLGNASIYWVYSEGGTGNRVVNAAEAATLAPSAITPATTAGYTARTLATDGSYLYFVDNSNASLVRTDLSGGNRTLIATTSGVQQVAVLDSKVYYVEWNNGVYSVPVTGGTPTQIFAPSFITSTCAGAAGGWGGISITSTNLFFSWFNGSPGNSACYGVYQSVRSGSSFGTPTKLPAPSGSWTTAGWLQMDGNDLYITTSSSTFYKTSDYSNWTQFSVSSASFSLQALTVYSSSIYMTSNTGSVYTMPKTDTTGSSISRLFTNAASSSGWQILAMAPPSYTVTYQHGTGASGGDLVQTIAQGSTLTLPSPSACPLSSTNPCFTGPTGTRQNGWELLSGTFSSSVPFPMTGQTVTPTSNVTLQARWTGGPVQFSTTSFLSTPNPMASIAFPDTSVGSNNQITVYAYNSGTLATSISNETIGGSGVSRQGGTCNSSGGTIAAGAQCTVILRWTPGAAGSLSSGQYQMQVSGGYFDSVTLTGLAATTKTVTFNNGGGTGTMANQVSAFAANLNNLTYTRSGYTFLYWTLFSNGTGTRYNNQASYPFSADQTLFAQWAADSHVVTYNTQGGSAVSNGAFYTGATVTLPAAPAKSGYIFDGWFTAASGGTALTSPYSPGVITDITLYAQWSVDPNGSSTSGLPHTGSNVVSLLDYSGALIAGGVLLLAVTAIRRRKA